MLTPMGWTKLPSNVKHHSIFFVSTLPYLSLITLNLILSLILSQLFFIDDLLVVAVYQAITFLHFDYLFSVLSQSVAKRYFIDEGCDGFSWL